MIDDFKEHMEEVGPRVKELLESATCYAWDIKIINQHWDIEFEAMPFNSPLDDFVAHSMSYEPSRLYLQKMIETFGWDEIAREVAENIFHYFNNQMFLHAKKNIGIKHYSWEEYRKVFPRNK